MSTILKKLSSRKLWLAIAGVASGIAIALGVDEGTISTVSGAAVSVISAVAYIIAEGKVDAASVTSTVASVENAVSAVVSTSDDSATTAAEATATTTAETSTDTEVTATTDDSKSEVSLGVRSTLEKSP